MFYLHEKHRNTQYYDIYSDDTYYDDIDSDDTDNDDTQFDGLKEYLIFQRFNLINYRKYQRTKK
jgi:hypothetical protein